MISRCVIGACLAVLVLACGSASAGTTGTTGVTAYVDGISDQSLPAWDDGFDDSYFTGLFNDTWVHGPRAHIAYARYVVQWNVMSGKYSRYLAEFEAWLNDVASIELKPVIALTSYDGVRPSSPSEYQTELVELLGRAHELGDPIGWLEAWNEPNGQGAELPDNAADFANVASAVCVREYACTVIAGDFEDSPDVASYEREYVKHLDPVPVDWGVHPYYSVEERSEAPYRDVRENLPDGGESERIWFTEVAARKCSDFGGELVENGEVGQALRARWLADTLIANAKPAHAFYYEFLLKERRQPACQTEGSDSALYEPSTDPLEPDRARPAASYIAGSEAASEGRDVFMANAAQVTLTGGVSL